MNGQMFFERFLRFSSPPPIFVSRGVKFIKLLSLGPGLSYIADIGIKRTGIGKFIPKFQRNYRSSFNRFDTSN